MKKDGRIKRCIAHNPDDEHYVFETDDGSEYCKNGQFYYTTKSPSDLTHRVNPDGSLWMPEAPEAPKRNAAPACGITVRSVTLKLAQTLPSGEEQTLIVEVTEQGEIITTNPAWTNGVVGMLDIIGTAKSCLSHAKLRLR